MRDVALGGGYQQEHTACPQKLFHRLKLSEMPYETATSSDRIFTVLSLRTSTASLPTAASVILMFSKVWTATDTARWGCQAGCTVALQPAIHLQSFSQCCSTLRECPRAAV